MDQPALEAHALTKRFGVTPVLRGLDFELDRGRGALVIGGNGAGKSTLLRILAGISAPSSGRLSVLNASAGPLPADVRRRIGVMTHQSFLYPALSARENLEFFARLYGLPDSGASAIRSLERVGLAAVRDERVSQFSRGMEQRLSAARALIADPDLLLLDEPFTGLDRDGVAMVAALLKDALLRGCAMLITAHAPLSIEGLELDVFELSAGRLQAREPERRGRLRSFLGS